MSQVDPLVDFARYQIFVRPIRLAIESKRATKSQLEHLLKLNVPIFHVESLGHLAGLKQDWQKSNQAVSSFVTDTRYYWNEVCL